MFLQLYTFDDLLNILFKQEAAIKYTPRIEMRLINNKHHLQAKYWRALDYDKLFVFHANILKLGLFIQDKIAHQNQSILTIALFK